MCVSGNVVGGGGVGATNIPRQKTEVQHVEQIYTNRHIPPKDTQCSMLLCNPADSDGRDLTSREHIITITCAREKF